MPRFDRKWLLIALVFVILTGVSIHFEGPSGVFLPPLLFLIPISDTKLPRRSKLLLVSGLTALALVVSLAVNHYGANEDHNNRVAAIWVLVAIALLGLYRLTSRALDALYARWQRR